MLVNENGYTRYAAITTSDTVDIASGACDAIYVGTSAPSNIVLVTPADVAVTFKNVVQGTILRVATKRVNATSTTAADLVALYYA